MNSLQLGEGIKSIKSKAFYGCGIATRSEWLSPLSLPASVEFIAEDAFADCWNINVLKVDSSNEFYESNLITEEGRINDWHAIIEKKSNKLILGCMNTIIPDNVNSIGDYAFYGVSRLTEIEIPEGVQTIGEMSFGKCSTLNTVIIPKSVTSIGKQAFLNIEDRVTLKVYENSYGHTYAINNNIKYELIDEGVKISGAVKSFGSNEDEETTIQLIKVGEEKPSQTVTVSGTQNTTYEILNVLEGSYIIKVIKNNHISREYSITVDNSDVIQDIQICLIGDINGDGKTNNKDWNRMYNHINDTNLLTGYELLCADANGDGKVNNKDWNRLYNHINGTDLLY